LFVRVRRLFGALWSTRRRAALSCAALLLLSAGAAYGGQALWLGYHLRAAERAHRRRDFRAARDHLTPYLEARPSDAYAHFLAARVARRDGRFDDAEAHLSACRRLHYPDEDVDLERVLLRTARGEAGGEDYLRQRVEAGHADTLMVLEVLIDDYLRNYRLWDALWAMNAYLDRQPDAVPVLLGRAFVWERLFSFADAERDYRRALALDPDNDDARRRFADLLLDHRATAEEAAAEFERLLRRQPDNPAYQFGLARCRRQEGREDEARRLLRGLLEREPPYPGALTEMGRVAAAEDGHGGEAIDWLTRAVAADPHDRQAYTALVNCLRLQGREPEALAAQQALDQLDADLRRIDVLTREALLRPTDPDLRCDLGMLFLRRGQEQEGLRWLGLALEQAPAHAGARRALADYFEGKAKADLAAPHRRFAPRP
jgi:tetratricopeptide (TPR) repeat protein